MLTIAGLFVLRKKRPEMERPYKAFGYPVLPAIYILLAAPGGPGHADLSDLRQPLWPGHHLAGHSCLCLSPKQTAENGRLS